MKKKYVVKLKVKEALDKRELSQKKLAEMSGIRESTISDIVRGTRTVINFEHLSKIAEALEVTDIRELIDFEQLITIQQSKREFQAAMFLYSIIKNGKIECGKNRGGKDHRREVSELETVLSSTI